MRDILKAERAKVAELKKFRDEAWEHVEQAKIKRQMVSSNKYRLNINYLCKYVFLSTIL